MLRSPADIKFVGSYDVMSEIRSRFNKSKICRHMITPDSKDTKINWEESDYKSGNTRVWLKENDYTASVEWSKFGDKLAIISFGEEAIGMIIESRQIAESFQQIADIISRLVNTDSDYKHLPVLASR